MHRPLNNLLVNQKLHGQISGSFVRMKLKGEYIIFRSPYRVPGCRRKVTC